MSALAIANVVTPSSVFTTTLALLLFQTPSSSLLTSANSPFVGPSKTKVTLSLSAPGMTVTPVGVGATIAGSALNTSGVSG